jgi:hypothetical protein
MIMGPLPGRRQGISGGLFAGVVPLWGRLRGRTRGAGSFAATGAELRPRRIRPAAAVTTGMATTHPPVIRCCRCCWSQSSAPFHEPETAKVRSLRLRGSGCSGQPSSLTPEAGHRLERGASTVGEAFSEAVEKSHTHTQSLEFKARVELEATCGRTTIQDRSGGCRWSWSGSKGQLFAFLWPSNS